MILSLSRPYRRVHQLTWTSLNRARWPENGSLAWQPVWGFQKPLPPASLSIPGLLRPPPAAPAAPLPCTSGPQRLQKLLQAALGLNAQDALALVQRSRVTVDGQIQKRDRWIEDGHEITVNGHPLTEITGVSFVAHKPAGFALTEGDPLKRPTYSQLLPDPSLIARPLPMPVDLHSSGLVVLTNHAALRAALTCEGAKLPPSTFMVRLRQRPSSYQLAVLETKAPYDGVAEPLLVEDLTDAQNDEVIVAEDPQPPDVGTLLGSSVATWGTEPPRSHYAPREVLPIVAVTLCGGSAATVRQGLLAVGAAPREICCVSWGPLSLHGSDLSEPGGIRPLSQEEVNILISIATGAFDRLCGLTPGPRLTLTRIPVFLLQAGRYFFEVQALRCEFARVAWLIVSEGCIRKGFWPKLQKHRGLSISAAMADVAAHELAADLANEARRLAAAMLQMRERVVAVSKPACLGGGSEATSANLRLLRDSLALRENMAQLLSEAIQLTELFDDGALVGPAEPPAKAAGVPEVGLDGDHAFEAAD
ncbi:ZFP36L1 [Symbiodinium natans]|uniref:ZFP36L1 protein n=1 Tax=Symbiodinium natans TaxID=878477 RepID=A0A812TMF0_9DINO|nr:ZFP36L1 [Symbiodinium natans]